ncbi:MAG: glycosyltransferase family 9 protein [bacterium]
MNNKSETIDIILPSRIGDCLLGLPALLCLKQLVEKFPEKKLKITVFSTSVLTEILKKLNLFEIKQFSNIQKLRTIFNPSNKAIFLHTTMDNHCFFAKKTYGINITGKKISYQNDMPYLYVDQTHKYIPESLFKHLKDNLDFSTCTISFFGMLLEIGFSPEEIIETFNFNEDSLDFEEEITNWKPEIQNYVVICMEAAYGSKGDADRRFKEESYFEVSKYIYDKFGLKSAFIGIDNIISLPEINYIYDFRKKLDFLQLAQLMKDSEGYLGNDTGPLHLANLMKKYSLGIYSRETAMKINYYPIFNNLNSPTLGFPEMDIVDNFCSKLVEKV